MNSRSIPSRNIRPRVASGTNRNSQSRRRPHWHRFGSVPGSRLPSVILPPVASLVGETKTNADCVGSALAVLRSTKRRKYCVDEHETQDTQDENDTNGSVPNTPKLSLVDNDVTERFSKSLPESSTVGVALQSRPKGWEWSMGMLPPARLSEDEKRQQDRQEQQYSRMITPLLYPVKFPGGRNSNSSTGTCSFLSAPEQGGGGVRRIGIRPCLETNAIAKH